MTSTSIREDGLIADFQLPASTGHTLSLDAFKGKVPLAMVFLPDADSVESAPLLAELGRRHKDFGLERSQLLAVVKATARQVRQIADENDLSVPILADASGSMSREYGVSESQDPVALVADREGRIQGVWAPFVNDPTDPTPAVDSLLEAIRGLERETSGPSDDAETE